MKFSLVDDVANWKKWWSMRLTIATVAFSSASVAYIAMPAAWQNLLPPWVQSTCAIGTIMTAIASGVARVISQPKLNC